MDAIIRYSSSIFVLENTTPMKKIFWILLAFFISDFVHSQTMDQQNTGGSTSYHVINSGNEISKQTFKAGLSGKLTTVYLDMEIPSCVLLTNMNVNINIYDSTGIHIIGNSLVNMVSPTSRGLQPFNFVSPVYLRANQSYSIEITVPSGQACDTPSVSANVLWYYGADDTTYANGTGYYNYSPFGFDYYFSTELMVCSNPMNGYISAIGYETCESGNGAIICNTTGGVGPFTYLWNTSGTDSALVNLSSGNYSVMVSDGANCGDHDFYFLPNAGTAVTASDTTVNTICFGSCDGYASVTVLTGVAPYSYAWSNSDTTGSISNVCAGNYTYTVTDINGCTFTNTVTVNSPNEITGSFITTNESCIGSDGYIDLTPIGDFPPFVYSWAHGPSTQDVSSLTVGSYTVTILDANGCFGVLNENVFLDAGATIDTTLLDVQNNLCFQSNGHISNLGTAVTTSNPPLIFTLNSQSIPMAGAFNLTAGTYNLVATDANGCIDSAIVTIQDIGSPISVNQGSTYTPPCPDVCTGTISVFATGGSGNYTYSWSNGYTVANGMNLCAGEYTVVVTDDVGCTGSGVMVINPAPPINMNFSINNATCGGSDGDALATVTSGGQPPYTFDWSNGDETNFADSLAPGNYSVMMRDANGCQAFRIVSVNTTNGPSITENILHPSCSGSSNGSIDLTVTGGTAPVLVKWATGHTSTNISSLSAGVYDVTVSDASGCLINKSYQLFSPSEITITPTLTLPSCGGNDGEISFVSNGGTLPHAYQWDSNAGNGTTQVASNLAAGIYEVTITDVNGCLKFFPISLSNDNAPMVNVDQVINPNCQTGGGAVFITASGGTSPYSYLWNNGSTAADLENVAEGNYGLIITDASNCISTATFALPGVNIFAQEICMITVDTATNNNLVVWEKTEGIGIEEFRVYRETSFPNNYLRIATVPFDSLSQFQDTVASSDIHAWKYKLATVDSCGNESSFIASHKSIHLLVDVNANGDVYLDWDDYIGFSYPKFYINRYHTSTGWQVIDSVNNAIHSYLDVNPPSGNVGYSITVPAPSDCLPTRAGVNTSRSNIRNAAIASPQDIIEENGISVNVYPNPAQSEIFISLDGYHGENFTLQILNAIGEMVYDGTITSARQKIDIREIPSGAYFISMKGENKSFIKKVMIVK